MTSARRPMSWMKWELTSMDCSLNVLHEIEIAVKKAHDSGRHWTADYPEAMPQIDIEFNRIIDKYASLSNEERVAIRKRISTDIAWTLLAFASSMVTFKRHFRWHLLSAVCDISE